MNNLEINTLIAEKILGYIKAPQYFKGYPEITHQDPSGGWYSIPEFHSDIEPCLNLISILSKNLKVNISVEDDEYFVKLLTHECFVGEGFSLNEALIKACLDFIKRSNYEILRD